MRVHIDITNRYRKQLIPLMGKELVTGVAQSRADHLLWMLDEIDDVIVDEFKAHRWVSFVQAMLIADGWTTVGAERNFTRGYFT